MMESFGNLRFSLRRCTVLSRSCVRYVLILSLIVMPFAIVLFLIIMDCGDGEVFSRYSMTYYVNIQSKTIKEFPTPGRTGEIKYYASSQDGLDPGEQGLRFNSSMTSPAVSEIIDSYLTARGFEAGRWGGFIWGGEARGELYSMGERRIVVAFEDDEKGTVVYVSKIGGPGTAPKF